MIVDAPGMNGAATLFVNLDWVEEHLGGPVQLMQAGQVYAGE